MMDTAKKGPVDIAEMERRILMPVDQAAPNPASVTRPTPIEVQQEGREEASSPRREQATALDELRVHFKTEVVHVRVPDFLRDAIEQRYQELRRVNTRVTRTAVVIAALLKDPSLKVEVPEGYHLL
jgi:hypothetical protein